jgi:tyrosine-protein kinase Etk/Wzc
VPLPSKKALILLGSLLFGFILAAMIIFIRELFSRKLEDPSYVEEYLNLPIYAIIPHSKNQEKLVRAAKRKLPGEGSFVLAERNAKDLAIEGIRSLRTTLQFALNEAKNNIIGITGSSPNIGKSFVSVNLAYVLADAGKRVLLIDADMRKGKIQAYFSDKKESGLAEILGGDVGFKQALQTINDKIDFIATGHYPKNPSELLISGKFTDFLTEVSKSYDVVLIDTPPVLAVTDAVIITKQAGINLLVVGSGKEELKEVEHAVKRLQKNKVEINGLVYNNIQKKEKSYGYYEYNYYYDYDGGR